MSGSTLLLLSFLSLLITLHFNNYNFENLFFRAGGNIDRLAVNQSVQLIFQCFIRPIPVVALVLFKQFNLQNIKKEVLLVLIVLLSNFPTSSARYYIATMYIPLIILYFKQFNNKYLLLNRVLAIGLLFVFPFLDQARRINRFSNLMLSINFNMFLQEHFDSYQMFMRVIDNNIITMGKQLLSCLFFFIPRTIWPSKAIGSGHIVSKYLGLNYDNVSMNYFGEGYINFGYGGIIIFTIIIAFINARLDKAYWLKKRNNWVSAFYLFFLGLEFFILRGDLLSSFSYTIGIGLSVIFVYSFATHKKFNNFNSKQGKEMAENI